jgi:hypothetical protein
MQRRRLEDGIAGRLVGPCAEDRELIEKEKAEVWDLLRSLKQFNLLDLYDAVDFSFDVNFWLAKDFDASLAARMLEFELVWRGKHLLYRAS